MANYWPEDWVVVKLNYKGKISYRVVAGWAGGYARGDHWRINSGIVNCRKTDEGFLAFSGNTGSTYYVNPLGYAMRKTLSDAVAYLSPYLVDVLPADTNWETFDYEH